MQRNNTEFIVENPEPIVDKSTLPEIYRPLMEAPSMVAGRCFICGRNWPLEQHHIVWRSWGNLYKHGVKMRKPTITLCGMGNHEFDADGKPYCHGLAHAHKLHFRFVPSNRITNNGWVSNPKPTGAGKLQYLITEEETKYQDALEMDGWKDVHLLRDGGLF